MKAAAVVAVALAAGTLVAPTPARAAITDCTAHADVVCLFEHNDYTGRVWRQRPSQIVGCRSLVPDGFNDKPSSWYNQTKNSFSKHEFHFWEHANCTGRHWWILPGTGDVALPSLNDVISAVSVSPTA